MLKNFPFPFPLTAISILISCIIIPPLEWPYLVYYNILDNAKHEQIQIETTSAKVLSSKYSITARKNKRLFIEYDEKLIFTRLKHFKDNAKLNLQCKNDVCFHSEVDAKIYMLVLIFMWTGLGWLAYNRY